MTYRELLKILLPRGCYSVADDAENMKDLSIHAGEIEDCQLNAGALHAEIYPDAAYKLLQEWERTYDIASNADISYPVRINNLLAAIRAAGGQSRKYFIALAARLGYTITIDEFIPFMAGWSEAGDEIYIEDIIYCWQVNAGAAGKSQYFEPGISCAGDSLNYFSEAYLEALFQKLKPAHTACVFNYT